MPKWCSGWKRRVPSLVLYPFASLWLRCQALLEVEAGGDRAVLDTHTGRLLQALFSALPHIPATSPDALEYYKVCSCALVSWVAPAALPCSNLCVRVVPLCVQFVACVSLSSHSLLSRVRVVSCSPCALQLPCICFLLGVHSPFESYVLTVSLMALGPWSCCSCLTQASSREDG